MAEKKQLKAGESLINLLYQLIKKEEKEEFITDEKVEAFLLARDFKEEKESLETKGIETCGEALKIVQDIQAQIPAEIEGRTLAVPTDLVFPDQENWEKEFDEKFFFLTNLQVNHYRHEDYAKAKILEDLVNQVPRDIKSFISSLLQKQKEEVIKLVEEMQNDVREEYNDTPEELQLASEVALQIGKMEAFSKIISALKEKD